VDYRGFFPKRRGAEGGMRAESRQGTVCSGGGTPHDPLTPSGLPPELPALPRRSANLRPAPGPASELGLAGREMAISTPARERITIITTKTMVKRQKINGGEGGRNRAIFFVCLCGSFVSQNKMKYENA